MTTSITSRYIDNMPSHIRTNLVEVLNLANVCWVTELLDLTMLLDDAEANVSFVLDNISKAIQKKAWVRVKFLSESLVKNVEKRDRLASLIEEIKALP